MNKNYMVVFERVAEENWGAWAPDIGGAVGAGDSRDSARKSVLEGIEIMLEDLKQRSLPAPEPKSMSVDFSEFDPDPFTSHYEIEWLSVEVPEPVSGPDQMNHRAA